MPSPKSQSPSPKHLKWLVESRKQNQEVSAHLYELLTPAFSRGSKLGYEAKTLVSIGFSLWRAAFLADKSGYLDETNSHAKYFLGEMIETNAIAFVQDKKAKGFTFNYYLANVRFRLAEFKEEHSGFKVNESLLVRGGLRRLTPAVRWRAYQAAFKDAVEYFEGRLNSKRA